MNGIITVIRFVTYTIGGLAIRKGWNWLNTDVDPIPFTKEFDEEYAQSSYNALWVYPGAPTQFKMSLAYQF